MTCRSSFCKLLAAASLAAGMLAEQSARAIEGIAWSPNRDEAPVADVSDEVSLAEFTAEILPEASTRSQGRLMSHRPARLSRPAPWDARTYIANEQMAAETLPAPRLSRPQSAQRSRAGRRISPEGLPVPGGETYFEEGAIGSDGFIDGGFVDSGYPSGAACCGDTCCEPNCCGDWNSCGPVPICCLLPRPNLAHFEVLGGVQGFTGPANRGGSGSFGFHEGFNWGFPLCGGCVSAQFGMLWTQSNFDGNYLTPDMRNQRFLTAGLFRRVDAGLQGGLAIDYLHDEWDYQVDVAQLRGEISFKFCSPNEVGFWFTTGVVDDGGDLNQPVLDPNGSIDFDVNPVTWQSNDLYAFFCRRQFACGGEGRVFGGFTGNSQGLMGADFMVPLNPCWSARAGFLYLTPEDNADSPLPDFQQEDWNVSVQLVWTPFRKTNCVPAHSRALFTVADNGSFATRFFNR